MQRKALIVTAYNNTWGGPQDAINLYFSPNAFDYYFPLLTGKEQEDLCQEIAEKFYQYSREDCTILIKHVLPLHSAASSSETDIDENKLDVQIHYVTGNDYENRLIINQRYASTTKIKYTDNRSILNIDRGKSNSEFSEFKVIIDISEYIYSDKFQNLFKDHFNDSKASEKIQDEMSKPEPIPVEVAEAVEIAIDNTIDNSNLAVGTSKNEQANPTIEPLDCKGIQIEINEIIKSGPKPYIQKNIEKIKKEFGFESLKNETIQLALNISENNTTDIEKIIDKNINDILAPHNKRIKKLEKKIISEENEDIKQNLIEKVKIIKNKVTLIKNSCYLSLKEKLENKKEEGKLSAITDDMVLKITRAKIASYIKKNIITALIDAKNKIDKNYIVKGLSVISNTLINQPLDEVVNFAGSLITECYSATEPKIYKIAFKILKDTCDTINASLKSFTEHIEENIHVSFDKYMDTYEMLGVDFNTTLPKLLSDRCDLLLMPDSPFEKNVISSLKRQTYILCPEGLYYFSKNNIIRIAKKDTVGVLWKQPEPREKNPHDPEIKALSDKEQEIITSSTSHTPSDTVCLESSNDIADTAKSIQDMIDEINNKISVKEITKLLDLDNEIENDLKKLEAITEKDRREKIRKALKKLELLKEIYNDTDEIRKRLLNSEIPECENINTLEKASQLDHAAVNNMINYNDKLEKYLQDKNFSMQEFKNLENKSFLKQRPDDSVYSPEFIGKYSILLEQITHNTECLEKLIELNEKKLIELNENIQKFDIELESINGDEKLLSDSEYDLKKIRNNFYNLQNTFDSLPLKNGEPIIQCKEKLKAIKIRMYEYIKNIALIENNRETPTIDELLDRANDPGEQFKSAILQLEKIEKINRGLRVTPLSIAAFKQIKKFENLRPFPLPDTRLLTSLYKEQYEKAKKKISEIEYTLSQLQCDDILKINTALDEIKSEEDLKKIEDDYKMLCPRLKKNHLSQNQREDLEKVKNKINSIKDGVIQLLKLKKIDKRLDNFIENKIPQQPAIKEFCEANEEFIDIYRKKLETLPKEHYPSSEFSRVLEQADKKTRMIANAFKRLEEIKKFNTRLDCDDLPEDKFKEITTQLNANHKENAFPLQDHPLTEEYCTQLNNAEDKINNITNINTAFSLLKQVEEINEDLNEDFSVTDSFAKIQQKHNALKKALENNPFSSSIHPLIKIQFEEKLSIVNEKIRIETLTRNTLSARHPNVMKALKIAAYILIGIGITAGIGALAFFTFGIGPAIICSIAFGSGGFMMGYSKVSKTDETYNYTESDQVVHNTNLSVLNERIETIRKDPHIKRNLQANKFLAYIKDKLKSVDRIKPKIGNVSPNQIAKLNQSLDDISGDINTLQELVSPPEKINQPARPPSFFQRHPLFKKILDTAIDIGTNIAIASSGSAFGVYSAIKVAYKAIKKFDLSKTFDSAFVAKPPVMVPVTAVPVTAVPVTAVPVTAVPVTAVPVTAVPVTVPTENRSNEQWTVPVTKFAAASIQTKNKNYSTTATIIGKTSEEELKQQRRRRNQKKLHCEKENGPGNQQQGSVQPLSEKWVEESSRVISPPIEILNPSSSPFTLSNNLSSRPGSSPNSNPDGLIHVVRNL